MSRIKHPRKHLFWLGTASMAVLLVLAILFLSGTLAPRAVDAAPMAQGFDLCSLLPPNPGDINKGTDKCDKGYEVNSAGFPQSFVRIYRFADAKSAQDYLKGRAKGYSGEGPTLTQAVGDIGFEYITKPVGALLGDAMVEFARGCLYIQVYAYKPERMAEERTLATDLDQKAKGVLTAACSAAQPPVQPPVAQPPATQPPAAQPPAAGRFAVGHGCSYNEPRISPGQVRCAAASTNEPQGAEIAFKWILDGQVQPEAGKTFTRDDQGIIPGDHTITVLAVDTKSKQESLSSSFQFTRPGAAPAPKPAASFAVNVNCAYDGKIDEVFCSAQPVNPPAEANLAYDWLWNGKTQGARGPNLTVRVPVTYTLYTIQVRATDSKGGQSTPVVSTQIRAGTPPASPLESLLSPEQWVAVNVALTGQVSADPPDPVKAAAATAAGAAILGLLLAANNALSGAASTVSQIASGVTGWQPAAGTGWPTSVPEGTTAGLPVAGTGRPTSLPEGTTAGPPAAPSPPTTLPEQGASIAAPPSPLPKPVTLPEQKDAADHVMEEVIESIVRFDTPEQGMASALFPSPPPKPTTQPEQEYTDPVLEEMIESVVRFDTPERGSASIAAPPAPPPQSTILPEQEYTDPVLEEMIESIVRLDTPEQGSASIAAPPAPPSKPTTLSEQERVEPIPTIGGEG